MTREIKFRLLSPSKNVIGYEKWYEGSFNKKTGIPSAYPCWLYSADGEIWTTHQIGHRYKDRYTGLKDKVGKEIYEGDVVLDAWGHKKKVEIGLISHASYEDSFAGYGFGFDTHDLEDFEEKVEVIGTIYSTPELLQK